MSRLQRLLLLTLASASLAGCRTNQPPASSHESDVIHYAADTPFWIFIPFARLTDDGRGYPARIALPPRKDWTTNRMEILVQGEVIVEGIVRLRPGSTVLQAISCAGGFSNYAFARKGVRVSRSSGSVSLYLRSRWVPGAQYREVWCDTKPDGPYLSPKDADGTSVGDYVLQPGDRIFVARAIG